MKMGVKILEALTGLEPVVELLQSSALPLGYSAWADAASAQASGENSNTHGKACKDKAYIQFHRVGLRA